MLLRPIHITSESNSDIKDQGRSLSASGPEAGCGTDTSHCIETQEPSIRDSAMQKAGRSGTSSTDSQNRNEEFNNGPDRRRLFLITDEESFEKKAILWSCKQKFCGISVFKNPFFYIFTWSWLFSQLAYLIPTFHLVARAKTLGIDMTDASYLISVAGKKASFNLTNKQKGLINFFMCVCLTQETLSVCWKILIFKSRCSVAKAPEAKRNPR